MPPKLDVETLEPEHKAKVLAKREYATAWRKKEKERREAGDRRAVAAYERKLQMTNTVRRADRAATKAASDRMLLQTSGEQANVFSSDDEGAVATRSKRRRLLESDEQHYGNSDGSEIIVSVKKEPSHDRSESSTSRSTDAQSPSLAPSHQGVQITSEPDDRSTGELQLRLRHIALEKKRLALEEEEVAIELELLHRK